MLEVVRLAVYEDVAPITVKWANRVKSEGGFIASNNDAIINQLQAKHDGKLSEFAYLMHFIVVGAWLEQCIGLLASELLFQHNAYQVTVDLKMTRTFKEMSGWLFNRKHTPIEREDILLNNFPKLKEQVGESGRLKLKK